MPDTVLIGREKKASKNRLMNAENMLSKMI